MNTLGRLMCCGLVLLSACTSADAQRTTRHKLKSVPAGSLEQVSKSDTLFTAADSTAFSFNGYEKALRSSRESFFVTNNTDSLVDRLTVELVYMDMQGRMLDRRTVDIDLEIKPGETRKADIRSWDTQKVMYYYRSPRPRGSSQATPYRLRIHLLNATRRNPHP